LKKLLRPEFLKVFIKNYQNHKGPLVEVSTAIKTALMGILSKSELSSDAAYELLQNLFGPNTLLKLAVRRNQDMLKAIASRFDAAHLTTYLKSLSA